MSLKAACFLFTRALIAGAVLTAGCCICSAQEVIHALTGVATKVDSASQTITLTTSDGSQTIVKDEARDHPSYDFDKALESDATAIATFDKPGDRVILYYFGDGWQQRAVAVKDLGQSPLKLSSGEVTHWDHHHHVVTIKAADGSKQTFQLDDKTAVDTPMGVVNGAKFDPRNGDRISIKYLSKDGDNEAVYASES
jgi:hypothetical protein